MTIDLQAAATTGSMRMCCDRPSWGAGATLWTAHVGDSRAVLGRGSPAATAVRLTQDHKPNLPRERCWLLTTAAAAKCSKAVVPCSRASRSGGAWRHWQYETRSM